MGWQRTAQRIGNTGVPCGGQMEGLEGLGGVTQPGPSAGFRFSPAPLKSCPSRAVGTCREGRCPLSRPRLQLHVHGQVDWATAEKGKSARRRPMRYYFASWSCSSAPVGAASCCVVVCVRIEQSRLIDKTTPRLIGRSPRPPPPRCDVAAIRVRGFPSPPLWSRRWLGGRLGGNDSRAFFSVSVRGCIIVFCRFGQWRVNMAGQTLQICRKLVDATADPRAGRVRVRLSRGIGGTATRSRKSTLGSRPARCATCCGDENAISIQRLSPLICLLLAMFPLAAACPLCGSGKRSPDAVDAWMRRAQGPKKGSARDPSSQWWKTRRLSSRKVIATCRRGGLSPAVSPLCSDAGSTAAAVAAHVRHEAAAVSPIGCTSLLPLHAIPPRYHPEQPLPEAKGKGSALRVAWQARLARLAFQLAVELMETANRNSRHGHGIRQNRQR